MFNFAERFGFIIGTLSGVGGEGGGVGDYTSLNKPYEVLIMCIKAPYPPTPYAPKGLYGFTLQPCQAAHRAVL